MLHAPRTLLPLLLIHILLTASATDAAEPTWAERLGWPAGSKVVIFHVDDAGMSHDSNRGAIEAVEKGVATSVSIMFPCPWATEIVRYVKEHPQVEAGVHLTLNSEWRDYRWGPLSGKSQVPGLVDKDGYLWKDVLKVMAAAKPDEVDAEIRAQLEQCRRMGLRPTHLDTHMGTLFARPDFIQKYVELGIETHIPVMLPAGHMESLVANVPLMAGPLRQLGKHWGGRLWEAGLPVLDDLHPGAMLGKPEAKKTQIVQFLRTLKPGVSQFIVHCTRPSEDFRFISSSGPMRLAELEAMIDPEVRKVVEQERIILTTWRELKQRRDKVAKGGGG